MINILLTMSLALGGGTDPGWVPADDRELVTDAQREAVERGLAYLASQQHADGSWRAMVGYKLNEDYRYTAADRGHIGVTSLAGMAFLAGGHLPGRGEYGPQIERALDFILSRVRDDGYITASGSRMYSHAFATLFLAEAQWLDTTNASLLSVRGERRRPEVPKLDVPLSFIKRATDKLDLSRFS